MSKRKRLAQQKAQLATDQKRLEALVTQITELLKKHNASIACDTLSLTPDGKIFPQVRVQLNPTVPQQPTTQ